MLTHTVSEQSSERIVFALDPQRSEWLSSGFTEDDAIEWRRGGFSPQDAAVWRCHTFPTVAVAAPWHNLDVPLATAKTMKNLGLGAHQAALWFPNSEITQATRITREQNLRIASWVAAGVPYDDWVYACVQADISFEDYQSFLSGTPDAGRRTPEEIASVVAYQWSINGFSESTKRAFRSEGITDAREARRWTTAFRDAGLTVNLQSISRWRKHSFEPEEVPEWQRAAALSFPHLVGEQTTGIAAKWRDAGFNPLEMYTMSGHLQVVWGPLPRSSEEVSRVLYKLSATGADKVFAALHDRGVPEPQIWDVEELRTIRDDVDTGTYLTVDEIAAWVQHGFMSPDSVMFWREQGVTPAEAADQCR